MGVSLKDATEEVSALVRAMVDVHAAQYGPAHVIFADQNLDRDWIKQAAFDSSGAWLDYLQQRRKNFPLEDPQQGVREMTTVLFCLEDLLLYPAEVLAWAEESFR